MVVGFIEAEENTVDCFQDEPVSHPRPGDQTVPLWKKSSLRSSSPEGGPGPRNPVSSVQSMPKLSPAQALSPSS